MNWKSGLLLVVMVIALAGCGGGSTPPPPPPPPAISVALSPAAPAAIAMGTANVSLTATVSNDSAAKGVNWSCTPAAPANACGSFTPASTASGAATSYAAPASVPQGGKVTITATSVSDVTKTASASVHITGITINITTAPPATMNQGAQANVAATVANDTLGGMVNWSCTPAGSCGSFNPAQTASGAISIFNASSSGAVTVTAASATDPSTFQNANVTVNKSASKATLNGQYAFLIQAPTGNPSIVPTPHRGNTTFVGSVSLDGNGNVLGGMEDIVSTLYKDQADPICPTLTSVVCGGPSISGYTVDPSGHGTLTIHTQNLETLSMSFIITSAGHAEIIEADGDPGRGALDKQLPSSFVSTQLTGNYSFAMEGVDPPNPPASKVSFGGFFNFDTVTSGAFDKNVGGTFTHATTTARLTAPGPDTNGRGQIVLANLGRSFTFYVVNSKVLRLFEDDNVDLMGGTAYSQGTAMPTLSGSFAYEHSGWNNPGPGRTITAGQLTTDGVSTITGGISDANSGGSPITSTNGKLVSGTYSLVNDTLNLTDAAATTMSTFNIYPVDPSLNVLDPSSPSTSATVNSWLLLHNDTNMNGTGVLIPQNVTAPASFAGNFVLGLNNSEEFTQAATTVTNELDFVGIWSGDGNGNFTNGLADYDGYGASPNPMLGASFLGTYAANLGRFTGTLNVTTPALGYPYISATANIAFYQASPSEAFVIQTDNAAMIFGVQFQQQLP